MIRLAANLTMLFTEAPALDRPALAAQAGFDGVEVLFPYDHPLADWRAALAGLPLALINTPPGDWAAGQRGFAAVPGQEQTFRDGFLRAAEVAAALGAGRVHVMAGNATGPLAAAVLRQNLAWAAAQAPDLPLCIEPLNPLDMPGYFLSDFDQAVDVIRDLGLPRLGLQYDLWHAARIHGDPWLVWQRTQSHVRHVQIAGFPARAEPDGADPRLATLLRDFGRTFPQGWAAGEYRPAGATAAGLGWLAALRAAD